MKQLFISLLVLSAVAAGAQEEVVQSGTPARLETSNGKVAKVFLQSLENGTLTFQVFKSDKNYPAPVDKISRLEFYPKYDVEATKAQYNSGEYEAVLSTLEPLLEPFDQYMVISNNLQDAYCMMMESFRLKEDYPSAAKCADVLMNSTSPALILRGQVNKALSAIALNNLPAAQKALDEIDSEAASLYLQACMQRAQQQPKAAIQTVCRIIAEHGNDLEWLAPSEMLCAELYLDMAMTNSAAQTARQVKNMYAGSNIAADAARLQSTLVVEEEVSEETVAVEPAAEEVVVEETETVEEAAGSQL